MGWAAACALRHVFHVLGEAYPSVLAFLIDRKSWPREARFCEGTDRYHNAAFASFESVVNRRAAAGAEIEDGLAAFVPDANELLRFAFDFHGFTQKARLSSKDATSSALAREAVADRDPNWVFAGCG